MAQIIGTVRCLQVSDDFGFTTIDEIGTSDSETLILWFAPGTSGGIPESLTSFTRVMHSMWISQLRTAHANNLTVTIQHPDNRAEVTFVRLGTL